MYNINSVLLEGRLTRDAEFHTTPTGRLICAMRVGANRYGKCIAGFADKVDCFSVEAHSMLAERCRDNVYKGHGVRIVGRLRQNRWKDDNGKTRSRVIIMAEHIEFVPTLADNAALEEAGASSNGW
jgi:single-strand DNA-binding protein